MHTRLIFQNAIYVISAYGKVDFLESTYCTLGNISHAELPALCLAETLIHLEEVACEETSLIATCSGTYFHLHVLGILRILWNECNLYLFLKRRLESLVLCKLFTRHLLHVRIRLVDEDILRLCDCLKTIHVALTDLHDVLKILVFLCKFDVSLLVADYVRVGDERAHLLIAALKTVKFF